MNNMLIWFYFFSRPAYKNICLKKLLPTLFGIYLDDSKTAELTESLKSIKAKESYVSVSEKMYHIYSALLFKI